jgi:pyruvate/2-oxoglutarate dehydrogenase complex dihydrolipoamide dehydrogenase (E3) component
MRIGAAFTAVRRPGDTGPVTLTLEGGRELQADEVLFATDRQPLTDDIGPETVGPEP